MTAVANPPSFQQINRSAWGASAGQGGLNSMNPDDVTRMFIPRKGAQRSNSSSSISSTSSSSSTGTIISQSPSVNGNAPNGATDLNGWSGTGARKKPQRTGPWPAGKAEPIAGVTTTRPQSTISTNGAPASSSMASIHQPNAVVPSQHMLQNPTLQQNGTRTMGSGPTEGQPVLYLLSMNGTFERKTISVPYYPDSLRIGRQTNAKTVPTPSNGYFDSKVLSRQHAEIWADRSGKIWIRDVKSSNGTFVNGTRLSPENRDSEPHELQTQDHLELGIDIVSEDQQTVVHHKVAAKVEHAGPLSAPTNIFDMNFGDLDPANGGMAIPGHPGMQMRGRTGSQSSIGSSVRVPGSVAGSNMNGIAQQRPMSFWLTPVTTEQIVKKLTVEMRAAKLETQELHRTKQFFDTLLSKDEFKSPSKSNAPNNKIHGNHQPNGAPVRFTDPPAPPPQQPLPEKPDARPHSANPPSIKRSNTEKPRSEAGSSPIRQESSSQILSLIEALASAKKQIDEQNARVKDLEELLRQEREARVSAEDLAKRLEEDSIAAKVDGLPTSIDEGSVIEEAFEPPPETNGDTEESVTKPTAAELTEDPTSKLQQRVEQLLLDMTAMKDELSGYKTRAETAETERDTSQSTLAEMVAKIRSEEEARQAREATEPTQPVEKSLLNPSVDELSSSLAPLLQTPDSKTDGADGLSDAKQREGLAVALSRHPALSDPDLSYHSAPYASMIGVVLIGMGIMAYLNGWQKVDR